MPARTPSPRTLSPTLRLGMSTYPNSGYDERPRASHVQFEGADMIVALRDGRLVRVPYSYSRRLSRATMAQRANWRLVGRGTGIHWPDIDEDLSVEGVVARGHDLYHPPTVHLYQHGRNVA